MAKLTPEQIRQRANELRGAFLLTQDAAYAVEAITRLHRYGRGLVESECLMILGESRVGKTHVLNEYVKAYYDKNTVVPFVENGIHITPQPILRVEVPADGGAKALCQELARGTEHPRWMKGSLVEGTHRLLERLGQRRVELIIIDEAHHLVDRRRANDRVIRDISEWIKGLLNRSGCPIVFAGIPTTEQLFKNNDQVSGRSTNTIRFKPFAYTTVDEVAAFCGLLRTFEDTMDLPKPSYLAEPEIAQRVYAASHGRIGHVSRLLTMALIEVLERGEECITKELLGDKWAEYNPFREEGINPFRVRYVPEIKH